MSYAPPAMGSALPPSESCSTCPMALWRWSLDLLSLMTSGPRMRTAGGLRVALTKVAASTPQRRAEVLALAIFLGDREQQVAGVRTWGEQRALLARQRGRGQVHHA